MFYWQPNQLPVLLAAQAQATSYTSSPGTGNQLYSRTQATSHTSSCSTGNRTGNQLYKPKQTVIDAA